MEATGPCVSRALLLLGCFSAVVTGRLFPQTPCQDIFNYYENNIDGVFGKVKLKNDNTGTYNLAVHMSIPMETTKNIKLMQMTPTKRIQNGEDIVFHIQFPSKETLPILTGLTFNERDYCTGPPAEGDNVTMLNQTMSIVTPMVNTPSVAPPKYDTTNVINRFPDVCGTTNDFEPHIYNGMSTTEGEHPWLVALFVYKTNKYEFQCAGNLISDRHVLTAAHCMKVTRYRSLNKDDIVIVMGSNDIKNWRERTVRAVTRYAVHEDFITPAKADIALLTMAWPVQFNLTIKPICMWEESDIIDSVVDTKGVVAGWGSDAMGHNYVNISRKVSMPIVAQADCLWSDRRLYSLTSKRTFCAGDMKGSLPCTGDSGSGFVIKRNEKWFLRGMVSVGLPRENDKTMCDGTKLTVFSDVPKYKQWIMKQMDRP